MDRAEAIRTVMGYDQQLHAELGHGPWDGGEAREALHALGVTDEEIDLALQAWAVPAHRHVAGEVASSSCPKCLAMAARPRAGEIPRAVCEHRSLVEITQYGDPRRRMLCVSCSTELDGGQR